ncbi:MAG: secondary thiamine-phosphate synthase enzyme YjbQ [Candidatus Cloacimonetes bacterium]|jgi:secondary thiamine-phosphate synthase enzyme|nr:secondary thiamine-phosphate synthase enzyme YjbQ [Candidatus Cloacimonadota bacterium]
MIKECISIHTQKRTQMIDITHYVREFIVKYNISEAKLHIQIPHTTAGVTINENCDPDVQYDLCQGIDKLIPKSVNIKHNEGNSDAHLKSSLIGVNLEIFVFEKNPLLGTWQGVYFWEFDGPRTRKFFIISE